MDGAGKEVEGHRRPLEEVKERQQRGGATGRDDERHQQGVGAAGRGEDEEPRLTPLLDLILYPLSVPLLMRASGRPSLLKRPCFPGRPGTESGPTGRAWAVG